MTAPSQSDCERMCALLRGALDAHPTARSFPPIRLRACDSRLQVECGVVSVTLDGLDWFQPVTPDHAAYLAGLLTDRILREWRWLEA